MKTRIRRPNHLPAMQAQSFLSRNGQAAFFAPVAKPFGQQTGAPQSAIGTGWKNQEGVPAVQPQTTKPFIQTAPGDKHDLTATALANDPLLEQCFDGEFVVKAPGKGDHVAKLQNALISLGFSLPKHGADSSYGDETTQAVRQFQEAAGMSKREVDGRVGKKTIGLLDLSLRNGRVELDKDMADDDFKGEGVKEGPCTDEPPRIPCTNKFDNTIKKAAGGAIGMINKVMEEQLPPHKTDKTDYPDLFNQIFRFQDNNPATLDAKIVEVRKTYETIKEHLKNLQSDKSLYQCGTKCDGGCRSRPAYATKGLIIFCPSVATDPERNFMILHETHHVVIPGSSDKAYHGTRLLTRLDPNSALTNASSFHVYAAQVENPDGELKGQRTGPKIKDINLINDPIQKDKIAQALAHLEMWFELVPFDLSVTIVGVENAHRTGQYDKKSNNPRAYMDAIGEWFGLTRPPKRPTKADIAALKAIEVRVKKMEEAFNNPFLILPSDLSSFWEQGPGHGIAVNDELLQLDLDHMLIALLQELVHATPSISSDREALYVGMINEMRTMRGVAP